MNAVKLLDSTPSTTTVILTRYAFLRPRHESIRRSSLELYFGSICAVPARPTSRLRMLFDYALRGSTACDFILTSNAGSPAFWLQRPV